MTTGFADHFSAHATQYAEARPHYPPALFDWIASQCPRRGLAWEAGCGNGQATGELARHFRRVIATDPSAAQVAAAPAIEGVEFRVEVAESPTVDAGAADLVFVAQALHWFEPARFHAAVHRTLARDGCFVAVCYGLSRMDRAVDAVIDPLYHDVLADYWPAERAHVDAGYASLPFPYHEFTAPGFAMSHAWNLGELLAYLGTWSAVQRYRHARGSDPLDAIQPALAAAWGDPHARRAVHWPLTVRAGRPA
jgi:SAM-dependent methyltransferase